MSSRAGFYGKLPSRGDFVARGLPRDFTNAFDAWLQEALTHSRRQLGDERWTELFQNAPLWRFALSPRLCGRHSVVGVMMPSVDRVGRRFPLVIGLTLDQPFDLTELVGANGSWFDRAEQLALTTLADDLDLNDLVGQVGVLAALFHELPHQRDVKGLHWTLSTTDDLGARLPQALGMLAQAQLADLSLWWTTGAKFVAPCALACRGLPLAQRFTPFIAGEWQYWGWGESQLSGLAGGAKEHSPTTPPQALPPRTLERLSIHSVGKKP
ncbi:MAG: type VI secretion system-associated protein TagF [Candidatus Competibacterales bacterium]